MQDKKVVKMAEMLLAGGKMLSMHCATCGSPLFEYGGRVVCPTCGEGPTEMPKPAPPVPEAKKPTGGDVERILRDKLDQLAAELEKETNRRDVSELLGMMKSVLEVLEKLRSR